MNPLATSPSPSLSSASSAPTAFIATRPAPLYSLNAAPVDGFSTSLYARAFAPPTLLKNRSCPRPHAASWLLCVHQSTSMVRFWITRHESCAKFAALALLVPESAWLTGEPSNHV